VPVASFQEMESTWGEEVELLTNVGVTAGCEAVASKRQAVSILACAGVRGQLSAISAMLNTRLGTIKNHWRKRCRDIYILRLNRRLQFTEPGQRQSEWSSTSNR
jgi:hypothetical protein